MPQAAKKNTVQCSLRRVLDFFVILWSILNRVLSRRAMVPSQSVPYYPGEVRIMSGGLGMVRPHRDTGSVDEEHNPPQGILSSRPATDIAVLNSIVFQLLLHLEGTSIFLIC